MLHTTTDRAHNAAEIKSEQTLLHNKADNLISLSIKTASGKTVTFSLSSQTDGLGVQATVDGGTLSDEELKAVGKLGSAFQSAVDGLTATPPKLDLSQLTQFDSTLLASVDLSAMTFEEDLPQPDPVPPLVLPEEVKPAAKAKAPAKSSRRAAKPASDAA